MPDHEKSEDRHAAAQLRRDRAEPRSRSLKEGAADSASAAAAAPGALIGALALFPLADHRAARRRPRRLTGTSKLRAHDVEARASGSSTDPSGRPIKAADVTVGSVFHVIPEDLDEVEHPLDEKAKAVVLAGPPRSRRDLRRAEDAESWSYDGIVAYSKICTHVGCPVALYEQQTHHLLCPCHQSTFDVADGARSIFGPAKRPLPQLPITVDDEGYLIAQSDFRSPSARASGSVWHVTHDIDPRPGREGRRGTADYLDERTGSATVRQGASRARSSRTTGRSCSARSRCSASSSCCCRASS